MRNFCDMDGNMVNWDSMSSVYEEKKENFREKNPLTKSKLNYERD